MTRQYIGARYVPLHKGLWADDVQYSAMDVVLYTDGNTYTAKQAPPLGTLPTNTSFWSLSANYSSQYADILSRFTQIDDSITDIKKNQYTIINVLEHGADNTGVADVSALVQSLIDTYTTLYFPKGTYLFENPVNISKSFVSIIGEQGSVFKKNTTNVGTFENTQFSYLYNKNCFFNVCASSDYNQFFQLEKIRFFGNVDCCIDLSYSCYTNVCGCYAGDTKGFIYSKGGFCNINENNRTRCTETSYIFDGGTSHYFKRCAVDRGSGNSNGFSIRNSSYCLLDNCSVDGIGSIAYAINNSSVVLNACACEIAGAPIIANSKSNLQIIGGYYLKYLVDDATKNTFIFDDSNVFCIGTIFYLARYEGDVDPNSIEPVTFKNGGKYFFDQFTFDGLATTKTIFVANKTECCFNGEKYSAIYYSENHKKGRISSNQNKQRLANFNIPFGSSVSGTLKLALGMPYQSNKYYGCTWYSISAFTIFNGDNPSKNMNTWSTLSNMFPATVTPSITIEQTGTNCAIYVEIAGNNINQYYCDVDIIYHAGNVNLNNDVVCSIG